MPDKRLLVTSNICFGSGIAGTWSLAIIPIIGAL